MALVSPSGEGTAWEGQDLSTTGLEVSTCHGHCIVE